MFLGNNFLLFFCGNPLVVEATEFPPLNPALMFGWEEPSLRFWVRGQAQAAESRHLKGRLWEEVRGIMYRVVGFL